MVELAKSGRNSIREMAIGLHDEREFFENIQNICDAGHIMLLTLSKLLFVSTPFGFQQDQRETECHDELCWW